MNNCVKCKQDLLTIVSKNIGICADCRKIDPGYCVCECEKILQENQP